MDWETNDSVKTASTSTPPQIEKEDGAEGDFLVVA